MFATAERVTGEVGATGARAVRPERRSLSGTQSQSSSVASTVDSRDLESHRPKRHGSILEVAGMLKDCSLSTVVEEPERCPEEACAFWQMGGDDLEGGCAIERLGLNRVNVDVSTFLLDARHRLERLR